MPKSLWVVWPFAAPPGGETVSGIPFDQSNPRRLALGRYFPAARGVSGQKQRKDRTGRTREAAAGGERKISSSHAYPHRLTLTQPPLPAELVAQQFPKSRPDGCAGTPRLPSPYHRPYLQSLPALRTPPARVLTASRFPPHPERAGTGFGPAFGRKARELGLISSRVRFETMNAAYPGGKRVEARSAPVVKLFADELAPTADVCGLLQGDARFDPRPSDCTWAPPRSIQDISAIPRRWARRVPGRQIGMPVLALLYSRQCR
jgi:hypothetical protein